MPTPSLQSRRTFYRNTLPPNSRGGGGTIEPDSKFSNRHVFRAGFLFCGLGAGARGFVQERARLGKHRGQFMNVGGIDIDPDACVDYRLLSDGEGLVYDLSKVGLDTIARIRALMGERAPHVIFLSPPCVGFSKLLSTATSKTQKYQDFNALVLKGLHLVCETWAIPPGLIVLENVPGIMHRGKELLEKARDLLRRYGYVFHEATHDCGEIGGLAQHRRRFLMVARHPGLVEDYVYQPPKRRVRACGEVLSELPLPGDPDAGLLHAVPSLSWLNWLRLALIPEGGDWRDLPRGPGKKVKGRKPSKEAASAAETHMSAGLLEQLGFASNLQKGAYGVGRWGDPAGTVTGESYPSNGRFSTADPLPEDVPLGHAPRRQSYSVNPWGSPFGTVRGVARASNGSAAVSQPLPGWALAAGPWLYATSYCFPEEFTQEVPDFVGLGSHNPGRHTAKYAITPWWKPARTVTGTDTRVGSGAACVAQPLAVGLGHEPRPGAYGVVPWGRPVPTITGAMFANRSNTPASVSQPLSLGRDIADGTRGGANGVIPWEEPAPTITGTMNVRGNTPASVSQPLNEMVNRARVDAIADVCVLELGLTTPVKEGQAPRECFGRFDVRPWHEPARTVAGSGSNGGYGVADPRVRQVAQALASVAPRGVKYVVMTWQQAAFLLASGRVDPSSKPDFIPVILSKHEGKWNRPLTTLELAVLQGLPVKLNGKPLLLSGRSVAQWRKRIGNAVPVGAAQAIANTLLRALIASKTGEYQLGETGRWVKRRESRRRFSPMPDLPPPPRWARGYRAQASLN